MAPVWRGFRLDGTVETERVNLVCLLSYLPGYNYLSLDGKSLVWDVPGFIYYLQLIRFVNCLLALVGVWLGVTAGIAKEHKKLAKEA